MKRFSICLLFVFLFSAVTAAQAIDPDNTEAATRALVEYRVKLRAQLHTAGADRPGIFMKLLDAGMWDEVYSGISKEKNAGKYALVRARYNILNNRYKDAQMLVDAVLKRNGRDEKALQMKAFLDIQAWRLDDAVALCREALKTHRSEGIDIMLGRALLWQKKYDEAMQIAEEIIHRNPESAGAYLLKGDVYFWNQQPELSEAPLRKSLEIDPFNPDARFSYGYAIWRRIDATQLDAMAAQWELALAVNPLHFRTNWHWGNGHTNLTYADYKEDDDDRVRQGLKRADSAYSHNHISDAIAITRHVENEYPHSVIPLLYRGSFYYMAFDMDRKSRLDSAENIFRKILQMKKHYGPAHNGLAQIIRAKRIPYFSNYDSITNVLNHTRIDDLENFENVFTDMTYYQGGLVQAMVWNQMYTNVVYFPFLSKLGRTFHVPPLHKDLAETMNSSYFRFMTTFDNRQWMDIRGVGSGAAAIEYVERGAYEDRNVVLHEYVHLFHGTVLTDEENRQIRSHYYTAMKEKRTLDYYSQNNESEYLAQTIPAYFEAVKVHPLDFKSMNTTADLKARDPGMYDFIDRMVKRHHAYLSGDKSAMASNWAQVYLTLSYGAARSDNSVLAAAYLDTALQYDSKYLPAFIAYADLKARAKDFATASEWLEKATQINPSYAPVYVAFSSLAAMKRDAGQMSRDTALQQQIVFLRKAAALEDDYQESARVAILLRELYKENSMLAEAISAAGEYAQNGPGISTYLRDRKDDASAFEAVLLSDMGYNESTDVLKKLVEQKPQNYSYRNFYADALAADKKYAEAIKTLDEAQRILAASGNARSDYYLRLAELSLLTGDKQSSQKLLVDFIGKKSKIQRSDSLRYIRLLATAGYTKEATAYFKKYAVPESPYALAEYYYTRGVVLQDAGDSSAGAAAFESAIVANPYLLNAYSALAAYYKSINQPARVKELKERLMKLKFRPSEKFLARFADAGK